MWLLLPCDNDDDDNEEEEDVIPNISSAICKESSLVGLKGAKSILIILFRRCGSFWVFFFICGLWSHSYWSLFCLFLFLFVTLSFSLSLSLSLLCLCFRLSRLSQQYRFCCIDTLLYIVRLASYPLGAFRTRAQIQVLSPNRSFSGPTEIPNSFEIPKNYFDFKCFAFHRF